MCHRTGKYTVCRGIRAFFTPKFLQAGTVKGLTIFVHAVPTTAKTGTDSDKFVLGLDLEELKMKMPLPFFGHRAKPTLATGFTGSPLNTSTGCLGLKLWPLALYCNEVKCSAACKRWVKATAFSDLYTVELLGHHPWLWATFLIPPPPPFTV